MERDPLSDRPRVSADRHALDTATAEAVRAFLSRVKSDHVPIDALVFGSRARGDHHDESDIDVAVILGGHPGDRYEVLLELSDVAYDVLLETSLRIQPLPLWAAEFDRPDLFSNPSLIEAIKRDGRRL